MGKHDRTEARPNPEPEQKKPSISFKLGPLEISGPLGLTGSGLVGIIIGIGLTLYVLPQFQQFSFLIDPVIGRAVSATMSALPTASPVPPAPILRLSDTSTNQLILPERGEYKLNPGQRVKIEIKPNGGNKTYRWTAFPERVFEPIHPTVSQAVFIVPETQDQLTVVTVCELDEGLNCRGGDITILIRATVSRR